MSIAQNKITFKRRKSISQVKMAQFIAIYGVAVVTVAALT